MLDDAELVAVLAEEREKTYASLQCFVPRTPSARDIALHVLVGHPVARIVESAADADLLVMGTHGRTGLQRVVMGSVAEKVVRKAPCPVLTVHPDDHEFVMP